MYNNEYYLNRRMRRMKPVARLIKLISSTGAGKTELTKYFAAKIARIIIGRCIGKSNTTITPRTIIFTEDSTIMRVATKKKKNYIDVSWFDQQMISILTDFVHKYGQKTDLSNEDTAVKLKNIVKKYMNPKSNISAVINLVDEASFSKCIDEICEVFTTNICINNVPLKIYAAAEANIDVRDHKYNPEKFKRLIRNEAERAFESATESSFQKPLRKVWKELNELLNDVYVEFFNINSYVSVDEYDVKEFDLTKITDEEQQFIDRLFDNNDLLAGKKVSIETLCEEIVLHVPMNENLLKELKRPENESLRESFLDPHGQISFAITDTMGLFHKGTSDEENEDYLGELVYNGSCDAIIFLAPLAGDTNGIKLKNAYEKVIENFSLDIPIIVINNKADIFLDQERKNQEDVDIDDLDMIDIVDEFNIDYVVQMIDREISLFNSKLVESQHKKRSSEDIHSYGVYFKLSKTTLEPKEKAHLFVEKYHPQNMAIGIMRNISDHIGSSADKLEFYLEPNSTELMFEFDENILRDLFITHLADHIWGKKVYGPAQTDINKSLYRVTPHGQSYYKLRRNIRMGKNSESIIDESWFKNVQSFAVNFPGNIKNLITKEFVLDVVSKALIIKGGQFEEPDKAIDRIYEVLLDSVYGYGRSYFRQEFFTSKLLFDRAILPAEEKSMTFYSKFQGFLEISLDYVKNVEENVKVYEDAFKDAIIDPLYLVAHRNVRYSRK